MVLRIQLLIARVESSTTDGGAAVEMINDRPVFDEPNQADQKFRHADLRCQPMIHLGLKVLSNVRWNSG